MRTILPFAALALIGCAQGQPKPEKADVHPALLAPPAAAADIKGAWIDPSKPAMIGDVKVTVHGFGVRPVTINSRGDDSREKYLTVNVRISNLSKATKMTYTGWCTNLFGSQAKVTDEHGNTYGPRIVFGCDDQVNSAPIYPIETVVDMLVFERPVDAAKTLYLELPAANIRAGKQLGGAFLFQLPLQ